MDKVSWATLCRFPACTLISRPAFVEAGGFLSSFRKDHPCLSPGPRPPASASAMGTSGFVMLDQRVALLSPCRAQVFASPPGSGYNIWELKGFFLLLLFARKMKCECSAHPIIMEERGLKKKKKKNFDAWKIFENC